MLSSINNCNNNDQSICHRPFYNESNQNSKDDDHLFSFFPISSPFIRYELELEDHNFFLQQQYFDLLLQHQPLTSDPDDSTISELVVNIVDSSNSEVNGLTKKCNKGKQQMPTCKRSSSEKDRHSKINTAKGPRDRRMRLSLDVARKFFDLQDMLGFDKPSKTVEWLLLQAKTEIKDLERLFREGNCCGGVGAKTTTSECEVEAVIDKKAANRGKLSVKGKKIKRPRMIFHPQAKDAREKARARARERTSNKKMWSKEFDHEPKPPADEAKNNELNSLGSMSFFGARKEPGTQTRNKNHSLEPSSRERPVVNLGNQEEIVDDALVTMGNWSASSVSNYYLQNILTPKR